jgi:hypothetical protein
MPSPERGSHSALGRAAALLCFSALLLLPAKRAAAETQARSQPGCTEVHGRLLWYAIPQFKAQSYALSFTREADFLPPFADVSGDGAADLLFWSSAERRIMVSLGSPAGFQQPQVLYSSAHALNWQRFVASDMNFDGTADIAVAAEEPRHWIALLSSAEKLKPTPLQLSLALPKQRVIRCTSTGLQPSLAACARG